MVHSCGFLNRLKPVFELNAKLDADSLLYLLSHFEWDGHTVHRLTQWRLPPPMTSTVKSSLFMHACYSPLSLAARLHRCHTNLPCYINSGWAFSAHTSSMHAQTLKTIGMTVFTVGTKTLLKSASQGVLDHPPPPIS